MSSTVQGSGERRGAPVVRAVQWAVRSDGSQRHRAGQPRQAGRLLNLTLDGHGWYCPRSLYDVSVYDGGGGFDGEGVGAEGVGAGVG
jgi:hypothetical protein